jgi:hypothetical protein
MRGRGVSVFAVAVCFVAAACSHASNDTTAPTKPGSAPNETQDGSTRDDAPPSLASGHASVPEHITAAGVSTPHGRRESPPASIARDCSRDVTDALQSWIDGVPDGSTMSLPAHACYRVEGTLQIDDRHDLLFEGNGATLVAKTRGKGSRLRVRGRSMLAVRQSTNITVRDLAVKGANPHAGTSDAAYQPDFEAQHAFQLNAVDGVLLDRVAASDVYGDFVYLGGAARTPSRRVTVARSHFDRSGRQGISVTYGDDVTIVGNEIANVARSLFDLEPNRRNQEVRRLRIEANTTGPVKNFFLANKGSGVDIGDVTVVDNVMRAPSGGLVLVFGPKWGKRGPFTFERNVLRVSGAVTDEDAVGAFVFANAANVELRDNVLYAPTGRRMPAVELRAADDVLIAGNRFNGTAKDVDADRASRGVRVTA